MPSRFSLHTIILLLVSYSCSNCAEAQTAFSIPLDSSSTTAIQNPVTGDSLVFPMTDGSTYCCTISSNEAGVGAHFRSLSSAILGESYFSEQGRAQPPVYFTGQHSAPEKARGCFRRFTGTPTVGLKFVMEFDTAPTQDVSVQCQETTIHGGFNTNSTEFNYLELQNIGTTDFTVEVIISNYVTPENSGQIPTFTLGARSRRDIDIHSIVGPGSFGTILIWHLGAPGSLSARLSRYRVTSTDPLSFELVASEPLETRKQIAGGF